MKAEREGEVLAQRRQDAKIFTIRNMKKKMMVERSTTPPPLSWFSP
jgi:hypothetical protein